MKRLIYALLLTMQFTVLSVVYTEQNLDGAYNNLVERLDSLQTNIVNLFPEPEKTTWTGKISYAKNAAYANYSIAKSTIATDRDNAIPNLEEAISYLVDQTVNSAYSDSFVSILKIEENVMAAKEALPPPPVSPELDNLYNDAIGQLDALQSGTVNAFPEPEKTTWTTTIANGKASLKTKYDALVVEITQVPEGYYKADNIQAIVNRAKGDFAGITTALEGGVDQEAKILTQHQAGIDTAEQARKDTEAKIAYQKKVAEFMGYLSGIMPWFNSAISLKSQLIYGLATKKQYDAAQTENLVQSLMYTVASSFARAYSFADVTISPDDKSNYLVLIFYALSDYFTFVIDSLIKDIHVVSNSPDYYAALDKVVDLIVGTGKSNDPLVVKNGFNGIIKEYTTTYFGADAAAVENQYLQQKRKITYEIYRNALLTMANNTDLNFPSALQLEYAQHFYNEVISFSSMLSEQEIIDAHYSLAKIYANGARYALASIVIGKDNSQLVQTALNAYANASLYFKNAGENVLSESFNSMRINLQGGIDALQQAADAANRGDSASAVKWYQDACDKLAAGGDTIESNELQLRLFNLVVQVRMAEAVKTNADFVTSNKTAFNEYISWISFDQSDAKLEDFKSLLSNMLKTGISLIGSYGVILSSPLIDTNSIKPELDAAVTLLMSYTLGQHYFDYADTQAVLASETGLYRAETYYTHALILLRTADKNFKKIADKKSYVAFYPKLIADDKTVKWNYEIIGNRHIAAVYIQVADTLKDNHVLAAQYYLLAMNKTDLADAMYTYLKKKLQELMQYKDEFTALYESAKQDKDALQKLSSDDWKPAEGKILYTSVAKDAWTNVIRKLLVAQYMGVAGALDYLTDTLNEYAQEYQKNVPSSYYPEVGAALIYFEEYVVRSAQKDKQKTVDVLAEIETLMGSFFDSLQALVTNVNDKTLLLSSTTTQKAIITWRDQFDQALYDQSLAIGTLGQSLSANEQDKLVLLKENVDKTTGDITFKFLPSKRTITIPDPLVKFADLYKEIGDQSFAAKNYDAAHSAYNSASINYLAADKLDLASKLTSLLEISTLLAFASAFYNNVIPVGSVSFGQAAVPQEYKARTYPMIVPSEITIGTISDFSDADYIDLARTLYLYYRIGKVFGTDQYAQIIKDVQGQGGSSEVTDIRAEADRFKNDLTALVNAHSVSFSITDANRAGTPEKHFNITNFPMPTMLSRAKEPYTNYPTALLYYGYAAEYFRPAASKGEKVSIYGVSYTRGNDTESYAKANTAIMNAYLSDAYYAQQQIDAIKSRADWKSLGAVSKTDMGINITDYLNTYSALFDAYIRIQSDLSTIVQRGYTTDAATVKNLTTLAATMYEAAANDFKAFLVGDPLQQSYQDMLITILSMYGNAIITAGSPADKYNSLYDQVGMLYNAAGKILVDQGKYFESLQIFGNGLSCLLAIPNPNSTVTQHMQDVYLNLYNAQFLGATKRLVDYVSARSKPISVTLCNCEQENITGLALIQKYINWRTNQSGNISLNGAELTMYNQLKANLEDAIIFYKMFDYESSNLISCVNSKGQFASCYNYEPAQSGGSSGNQSADDAINKAGAALVDTYTASNGIVLDSMDNILTFIDQSNFEQLLKNAFQQFSAKIVNSTDVQSKAIGYAAIANWTGTVLYNKFVLLYMNDFYGDYTSQNAWETFSADINQRINVIRTGISYEDVIGTFCECKK